MQKYYDFHYFKKICRPIYQTNFWIKKEFLFNCLMEYNKLIRFVINNLIYIEKISEYEILLIYAKNICRKF